VILTCCVALFVLAAVLVLALFVTANDRDYWRTSALRLAEENRDVYAELDKYGDEMRALYRGLGAVGWSAGAALGDGFDDE
jgi:hypothetical protein